MKRSFRVATVFTGAVACTAALTPAAKAAPAAEAITAQNCSPGLVDNVHLYYAANQDHPLAACVGGRHGSLGLIRLGTGKQFSGMCGGAYSGSFAYHVPGTNISGTSSFAPGYQPIQFNQPDSIEWLSLHGYHRVQGETSCPDYGS
jgi:hypothetical protein